jgi:hypothetical protein
VSSLHPLVEKRKQHIDSLQWKWIEKTVQPRVQKLLDRVQSRIRTPIELVSGNGTFILFTPGRKVTLNPSRKVNALLSAQEGVINERLSDRFPELEEIGFLVGSVLDEFNMHINDMKPTVPPKSAKVILSLK